MTPPPARERLNRHLARRGVASRRHADELISAGRVAVNGHLAQVGETVSDEDSVTVDGRSVRALPAFLTLLLNKPPGFVTTTSDPQHRPTVMQLVPPAPGLVPVGRLDSDSRGLLLLTNDGELAHRVAHPRFGLRRTYHVRLASPAADAQLRRLTTGVELDDGKAQALAARRSRRADEIEVVMGEGRRREVRRLCAALGLEVVDLRRTHYGPVGLGSLPEGQCRPLDDGELRSLRLAVGLSAADDV
ncbi:MAG: rRNA pseudouridine synthase [Candidatus Dormibacteraeota bacterium]|nr:rRNA pseudouridine synthase [Candidatus Dormibacteraeota bacterium]